MSGTPAPSSTRQRALAALVLTLWGAFHVAAFVDQREWIGDLRPRDVVGLNVFWVGNFHMFTGQSTKHSEPVFQGYFPTADENGPAGWRDLPMAEWYPARWESGYRWERPPVYKYDSARVPFLVAACQRSGAQSTRIVLDKWSMKLGTMEQPKKNAKRKLIRTWDCDLGGPRHSGRRL